MKSNKQKLKVMM